MGKLISLDPSGVIRTRPIRQIEVNIAPIIRRTGRFTIPGVGLTIGDTVTINQANGPYTGKGTRADEAEMDGIIVHGQVVSATAIDCYWQATGPVKGNFKFNYSIGG